MRFLILASLLSYTASASAMTYYVAPNGRDANPGTRQRPFAPLERTRQAARGVQKNEAREIVLRGGTYYLSDTLVLTAEDSELNIHAYTGEKPVLSGGQKLDLKWEPHANGIWKTQVPMDFTTDQLFINGERQVLARYPNFKADERIFNGYAADASSPARAAGWGNPQGGYLHAMHRSMWGGFHYVITGKNEKGELTTEGGWQNNRRSGMHPEYRFVAHLSKLACG